MRFGWGVSGSRRRQAQEQEPAVCKGMRFATLPCQCAKSTLFAPAGQRRFRVARLILGASRERAGRWGALPIRNGWQARRGTGKGPRRFTIFRTRKSQRSDPSAAPCFPCHPAGGTADSARTRSRDLSLENPFLGNWPPFSRGPHAPKIAAGGRLLLLGLPRSIPSTAPIGTKRSAPTPCSWGGCTSNPSQRHGPAALPPRTGDLHGE